MRPLAGISLGPFLDPLPLGILLGLFLGKRLGVSGSVWLGVRVRLCSQPSGATWPQIYGVARLAGIDLTISLFIGTLANANPSQMVGIQLGELGGSIFSACLGYLVLRLALSGHTEEATARQGAYSS